MKANLLKCLGHTKRLEILSLLRGHSLTVGQITQMTGLRQAGVSQHLLSLKSYRLVTTQKQGKEVYYSLSRPTFSKIVDELRTFVTTNSSQEPKVTDPVCHMHLTPSSARYTCEYDGVRHYFCGRGCLKQFQQEHI